MLLSTIAKCIFRCIPIATQLHVLVDYNLELKEYSILHRKSGISSSNENTESSRR